MRARYTSQASYREASSLLHAAAEQDSKEAKYYLGLMHEYGKGVEQDFLKAYNHYRQSSNQGYVSAPCSSRLDSDHVSCPFLRVSVLCCFLIKSNDTASPEERNKKSSVWSLCHSRCVIPIPLPPPNLYIYASLIHPLIYPSIHLYIHTYKMTNAWR